MQFQYKWYEHTALLLSPEALQCRGKSVRLLYSWTIIPNLFFAYLYLLCTIWCFVRNSLTKGTRSSSSIQGRLSHTAINPLPTFKGKKKPQSIHLSIQQLFSLPVSSAISEKSSIFCFHFSFSWGSYSQRVAWTDPLPQFLCSKCMHHMAKHTQVTNFHLLETKHSAAFWLHVGVGLWELGFHLPSHMSQCDYHKKKKDLAKTQNFIWVPPHGLT